MEQQENGWALMQFRNFLLPFGYGFGLHQLGSRGKIAGNAEPGFWVSAPQYFFEHGVIAERRFNK